MILSKSSIGVTLIFQLSLAIATNTDDVSKVPDNRPFWLLGNQDFKLTAQLKVIRNNSIKIDERIKVYEHYSNSQRRARLDLQYYGDKLDRNVNYYYAESLGDRRLIRTVKSRGSPTECRAVDADSLASGLFGEMSSGDKHLTGSDWLFKRDEVPDHFIGLGRLLLIVEAQRGSFVYTTEQNTEIRNQKVIRYSSEVRLGGAGSKPSQLVAYYGRTSVHWDSMDFPIRVWLTLPDRAEIIVDFLEIEPLKEVEQYNGFSTFTLPPGIGCSLQFELQPQPAPEIDTTGKGSDQWPKLVSFRASINKIFGHDDHMPLSKYFVAYDGYTRTLRRDSLGIRSQLADYSTTIHDLKRDLKFNIHDQEETTSSDGRIIEDLENEPVIRFSDSRSRMSRCVSVKVGSASDAKNPYEPIIPFDKLVELGQATVRGVRTVAYEQTVKILPEILFPRVNFKRINNQSMEVHEPNLATLRGELNQFSLVYYIPNQVVNITFDGKDKSGSVLRGEKFGILMRMDVFFKERLNYRADIYDYIWQLSDAPNGDRQHELFSINNKCPNIASTSPDSSNAAIRFKMSYQNDRKVSMTNSSQRAYELLKNPLIRNQASIRALAMGSSLSATQIGDIESHLTISSDEKSLQVDARGQMNDLRAKPYSVVSIGSGGLLNMDGTFKSSVTFEQCLWEAAHKRLSGQILFTFCFSICRIDDKPMKVGERGEEINSSKHFYVKKDESLPCQIFKLVEQAEPIATNWKLIYNSLHLQVLRLPMFINTMSQAQYLPRSLAFGIEQVEITNNKWSSATLTAPIDRIVLSGLSLTENGGKLMRPTRSNHVGQTGMDFAECQASCVADLECRSFSICYFGQQVECRKSDLDFRNEKLLQRVKEQVNEFRSKMKANARGIIRLKLEQLDEDRQVDANNNSSATILASAPAHIELQVDKKCELNVKQALGMFKVAPKVLAKIRTDMIIGVDNEEQCAEFCLAKNVKFFRRLARAKLNISSELLTNLDNRDGSISKLIEQRNNNMRSWCAMFRFVNLMTSTQTEGIRSFLNDPSKANNNGLCILSRPSWAPKSPTEPQQMNSENNVVAGGKRLSEEVNSMEDSMKVLMDSYEFVYANLYERQSGFILNPSGDSNEGQPVSNQQLVSEQSDVEVCARACFSQTIGLKPWCKSFDFILDRSLGLSANKRRIEVRSFCVFNSISLADITERDHQHIEGELSPEETIRLSMQQLIRESAPERVVYTHFEPRNSYTLDHIVSNRLKRQQSQISGKFELRTGAILLLLLLSFCSGLTVGLTFIGPLLIERLYGGTRRESIEYPSRAFLNSLVECDSISHKRFELDIDQNI